MALFPQSFIDEVRSAADIVAVISDSVSLRKAGSSYKGLCPFHSEKSPSFTVNRDKGFFHCFGCGAGGDVFKFVELQDKLGFQEAARTLAQRFGVPIPELEASDDQRQTAAEREALVKIHELAVTHYREQLDSQAGARIRQYPLGAARTYRRDGGHAAARLRAAGTRRVASTPVEGRILGVPDLHQRLGDQAGRRE